MPTMNIKDPEVHRMAHELATRRGTTATGAVRQALQEALERDDEKRASRTGMAERLLAIAEEARAIDSPYLTDEDLYDERGLPR
jgi:antitoxin VapB